MMKTKTSLNTRRSLLLSAIAVTLLLSSGNTAEAQNQENTATPQPVVTHVALIKTSLGDIEVELYGKDAPLTVANFVGLAEQDFYNGILFHRVVPGFVVQAGDPQTKDPSKKDRWGRGGSSIYDGKEFEDELDTAAPSSKRGYQEGVLAMANRGPNTNTSQFFIISGSRAASLPFKYTIFGMVRKGMDVVKAMEKAPLQNSVPKEPIKIISISVSEGTKLESQ